MPCVHDGHLQRDHAIRAFRGGFAVAVRAPRWFAVAVRPSRPRAVTVRPSRPRAVTVRASGSRAGTEPICIAGLVITGSVTNGRDERLRRRAGDRAC
jgi:hypothetical protein